MRGDTIETRSGSLIRLVKDFGDSNRIFASLLRSRFVDWPSSRLTLGFTVQLRIEYDRHIFPWRLLKNGTMYGMHAVQILVLTCTCVHIVVIQRSYSGLSCGDTWYR